MAETVIPGTVCDLSAVREATCIHTRKIIDSCQAKDCAEDLRLYLSESAEEIVDQAQSVKCGRARLLHVQVGVEPAGFSRGYYCVNLRYFYKVNADAFIGSTRPQEFSGLAVFEKCAMLFGGEQTTQVFTSCSDPAVTDCCQPIAVVEAVEPVVLEIYIGHPSRDFECAPYEIPQSVLDAFDAELNLDSSGHRRVFVTLGQFSILRMERDAQLLIPVYDYCIPDKECSCERTSESPCEVFHRTTFPVEQFIPSTPTGDIGNTCC